jgi:hypothetical protein
VRTKLLYAALLPIALLGVHVGLKNRSAAARAPSQAQILPNTDGHEAHASEPGPEIPQPDGWVPFEADVEITLPGAKLVLGKFHRASDGSSRQEAWGDDPSERTIDIVNSERGELYRFSKRRGWRSKPTQAPPVRLRYRIGRYTSPYADRVEGYVVYLQTGPSGDAFLVAPDLNFMPLVTQDVSTGKRIVYKNIKKGEPARALFLPPPGVEVAKELRLPATPPSADSGQTTQGVSRK